MISRKRILGVGLAVGIMLAGGTGIAVAATSTPAPTTPPTTPTTAPTCVFVVEPGKALPKTPAVSVLPAVPGKPVPCAKIVRGAIPVGAPHTGGGGMAAEVSAWG